MVALARALRCANRATTWLAPVGGSQL